MSVDLSRRRFEERLGSHQPANIVEPGLMRAAVAAILRFDRGAPDVLLMKRAERAGDGWSGHVSLPGGREAGADINLRYTAVRETREEVGLDLEAAATPIGQLDTIRAMARGRVSPLTVTPFVFVQVEDAPLLLGEEAVEAFWLPLEQAASGALADTLEYQHGAERLILPCWRYQGHKVWGLTYQMLAGLLQVVAR